MGGVNPDVDTDAQWEAACEAYEDSNTFEDDLVDGAVNSLVAVEQFRSTATYQNGVEKFLDTWGER